MPRRLREWVYIAVRMAPPGAAYEIDRWIASTFPNEHAELVRHYGDKIGAGSGRRYTRASYIAKVASRVRQTQLVATRGLQFRDPHSGLMIEPTGRKIGFFF